MLRDHAFQAFAPPFAQVIVQVEPSKPPLLATLVRHYDELVDHVRRRFGERVSVASVDARSALQSTDA